jgi:3-methylcrotonyl-CoA carboxylase alpha subunit
MLKKILIANRGEIACRIIRTARRMGIGTVAVYSAADADALHVTLADKALVIGGSPARESYLDMSRIIAAARQSGADAIHPGYGFLSENAAFGAACDKARIVFIGPPAKAIRAMGDKAGAKTLMQKAGVPIVPGYHGKRQDAKALADAAGRLGFPLLIKAASGGGGRGMRVVERAKELPGAIDAARREAEAGFGDGRLILERYLRRPRHIEVQVFADSKGNAVHLFERDCSVQRRHQKVIEEAPAPGLSTELRGKLYEAALAAVRVVDYRGAGTVEFVLEDGAFYFIEMNTRLQVEHVVTEMVTGLDLVEWQIRIAAGEKLPLKQKDIALRGHAIEARLYAEDPARDFLPSPGVLTRLRFPEAAEDLRIETGVRQGDRVSEFYDPMIAKLVAWSKDRRGSLARLRTALGETRILGLRSNRDFLLRILGSREFGACAVDTGLIARNQAEILAARPAPQAALAAVALSRLLAPGGPRALAPPADRFSPWRLRDGWQLAGESVETLRFDDNGTNREIKIIFRAGTTAVDFGHGEIPAQGWAMPEGGLALTLGNQHLYAALLWRGGEVDVALDEGDWTLGFADPLAPRDAWQRAAGLLVAPMPGKVAAVLVKKGARVKRGQILMVIEAMKMEHAIVAPADGMVAASHYDAGDTVEAGAELLVLAGAS